LRVLDSDDRMAEMLAMRDTIRKLEARLSDMELKLSRTPIAAAPEPPVPAPPPVQAATPTPAPAPAIVPRAMHTSAWYESPWMLPALLASLAALLAGWLVRRRSAEPAYEPDDDTVESAAEEASGEEIADVGAVAEDAPVEALPEPDAVEPNLMDTLVIAIPAVVPRIPAEDQAELRRRYMEERFPEIVNGGLVLDDPDSVVNAARLLYDDGAVPRAIELLQFAIEQDAGREAPWLALFEIFRRERLVGEFGRLARRFGEAHDGSPAWRKILRIGRDMDPGDALYHGPDAAASFDPEQEDWLRASAAQGDGALAAELRERLMAQAAVRESDLRADPTPALRKSEDFTVA
jgi:pilus assembly protein FimV